MSCFGRARGQCSTLILLGLLAPMSGCGVVFHEASQRLPAATSLAIAPVARPTFGLLPKQVVDDSTIAERLREAVFLEVTARRTRYSVKIVDLATLEADVRLVCAIVPRYSVAPLGEFTGKGSHRVTDDRFLVDWGIYDGNGSRIWGNETCTARQASSSLQDLRKSVGAKIAARLPYRR